MNMNRKGSPTPTSFRDAGFTMVEMMVAIVVLLIAVLSAFSSQVTSMNLVTISRENDAAVTDLQGCMEQVLLLPASEIPVAGSPYAAGQPIAAYEGLHLEQQRIVATYPGYVVGGDVPDPLTIVLTVTWQDYGGRPRSLVLRSMKAR
jgi:prepilin-type N-terminal cleavage/methylation domain-containing protein